MIHKKDLIHFAEDGKEYRIIYMDSAVTYLLPKSNAGWFKIVIVHTSWIECQEKEGKIKKLFLAPAKTLNLTSKQAEHRNLAARIVKEFQSGHADERERFSDSVRIPLIKKIARQNNLSVRKVNRILYNWYYLGEVEEALLDQRKQAMMQTRNKPGPKAREEADEGISITIQDQKHFQEFIRYHTRYKLSIKRCYELMCEKYYPEKKSAPTLKQFRYYLKGSLSAQTVSPPLDTNHSQPEKEDRTEKKPNYESIFSEWSG